MFVSVCVSYTFSLTFFLPSPSILACFYFIIIIILDACLYSDERVGREVGSDWEEFGEGRP